MEAYTKKVLHQFWRAYFSCWSSEYSMIIVDSRQSKWFGRFYGGDVFRPSFHKKSPDRNRMGIGFRHYILVVNNQHGHPPAAAWRDRGLPYIKQERSRSFKEIFDEFGLKVQIPNVNSEVGDDVASIQVVKLQMQRYR